MPPKKALYPFKFESTIIPTADKIICKHESPELNIGFVSNSGTISLAFNLEKISLDTAVEMMNKICNDIECEFKEVPSDPLDLLMVMSFNDKSDENIEKFLQKYFGIKPTEIKKTPFGMSLMLS